jgi:Asp-tRNA(Asn)/Glu-tRNA(Gln) amidotransferase B subunit
MAEKMNVNDLLVKANKLKELAMKLAKKKINKKVLRAMVSSKINNAQEMTEVLMREKLITPISK